MPIQTTPTGLFGPAGMVAFGVARVRVPEQIGVVVEDRQIEDAGDLPVADRKRVLLAADRHWRVEENAA